MGDFHAVQDVKATREALVCEQCGQTIKIGSPTKSHRGCFDGQMYAHSNHVECDAAAVAYAGLHMLSGEDWPFFQHGEFYPEDKRWLIGNHPVVAKRLGWTPELEDA